MTDFWEGFLLGSLAGASIGMVIAGLCKMASHKECEYYLNTRRTEDEHAEDYVPERDTYKDYVRPERDNEKR